MTEEIKQSQAKQREGVSEPPGVFVPAAVSLGRRLAILSGIFLLISSVTLGGGMTMLPVMQREFVEKRRWLTAEELLDIVAAMQSLPGLIAANMAVLIGNRIAGFAGGLIAGLSVSFPPFLVILAVAFSSRLVMAGEAASHVFLGVRASVCALVLSAVWDLGRQILVPKKGAGRKIFSWVLFIGSGVAVLYFEVPVLWCIVGGMFCGIFRYLLGCFPRAAKAGTSEKTAAENDAAEGGKQS